MSKPTLPPPGTHLRHKSSGNEYVVLGTGHLVSVANGVALQPFHALQFPEAYEVVKEAE